MVTKGDERTSLREVAVLGVGLEDRGSSKLEAPRKEPNPRILDRLNAELFVDLALRRLEDRLTPFQVLYGDPAGVREMDDRPSDGLDELSGWKTG